MELIVITVLSVLMPILCIASFVVGYNVNAQRKIFKIPAKKAEKTADEIMLDRIDKATI